VTLMRWTIDDEHEPPPEWLDDVAGDWPDDERKDTRCETGGNGASVSTAEVADDGLDLCAPPPPPEIQTLDELLAPALDRARRRSTRIERPVPLPWYSIAEHFGGGLWPGVHYLVSGTGTGKTAMALQMALGAARVGVPVLYIGLELEAMQIALRLLGEAAGVPWSSMYTGQAGDEYLARAEEAVPLLTGLPFHVEFGRPQGWPASELGELAERMRRRYPEPDGPGSRPFLVVLDYLQILGAEPTAGRPIDLRERIGRAAYQSRDIASRLGAAVECICSTARDRYGLLADVVAAAGLTATEDSDGRPQKRRVLKPDVLVGTGKESGEIEYSGDSVSVIARLPGTRDEQGGCETVLVTAKGRATGSRWSPLHWSGWGYSEPADGGAGAWEAMRAPAERRATKAAERQAAKATEREQAAQAKARADASAVVAYVTAHPGCPVREARRATVADQPRRWGAALDALGSAFASTTRPTGPKHVPTAMCTIVHTSLPPWATADGPTL